MTARAISGSGGKIRTDGHSKKLQQPLKMSRRSRFSATKNHRFRTCRPLCFPHLSSSSDLRILSSTQPSQVSPMTDFRQVWCLHAYSGGTVRDSHPVFYSPAGLLPHPQALKWNIYLPIVYHLFGYLSIEILPASYVVRGLSGKDLTTEKIHPPPCLSWRTGHQRPHRRIRPGIAENSDLKNRKPAGTQPVFCPYFAEKGLTNREAGV